MGFPLAIIAIILILWLATALVKQALRSDNSGSEIEKVDIIEGGCIVEQQRWGRERWRRAEVEIPSRPLSFEEELNLRSILASGKRNVKIIGNDEE